MEREALRQRERDKFRILKNEVIILGITETKKKGIEEMNIGAKHILIYSGTKPESRGKGGLGCIMKQETMKYVNTWKGL